MYLTVSRGNSSENTDHSWAEINTCLFYTSGMEKKLVSVSEASSV